MKRFIRFFLLACCMSMIAFCLTSCSKEVKQGKVEVGDYKFSVRQDTEHTFTIDARGTIRNIGDVDVKNVVVYANCLSCTGKWGVGQWQFSPDIERVPQQMDTISYIVAGSEESFSFTEVADYLLKAGEETAPELPEKLEIVIESFETVQ